MRVGLVGCVKSKRSDPAPTADLYTSALFEGRRQAVEASCDRWLILSAKHGVVRPDDELEPYDETLVGRPASRKREWAQRVLRELDEEIGSVDEVVFEIHAGADYCEYGLIDGLLSRGASISRPAEGLSLGQQLAYYGGGTRPPTNGDGSEGSPTSSPEPSRDSRTPIAKPPTGKYRPLYEHLVGLDRNLWQATFSEVEEALAGPLPDSARRHRPWWANTVKGHSHARAWLAAGFETSDVDMDRERVTFVRD